MKHGILSIQGADCPSCIFTIEYNGRKLSGVKDIRVDFNDHKIHVDYRGGKDILINIEEIVKKLGYSAKILSDDKL